MLLLLSSCQDKQSIDELAKYKEAESIEATNIELAKKFYHHLDALEIDSIYAICIPGLAGHYGSGDPLPFSAMEPMIEMFYGAFPDYNHKIEAIFGADDKVVCRLLFSGTFTNSFMEMPPSGESFQYKGIQIFQFASGKITNFWAVEDELALMTQLGLELGPAAE